jgi:hypothetical protein
MAAQVNQKACDKRLMAQLSRSSKGGARSFACAATQASLI